MMEIPICIEMDEEIENALASSGLTKHTDINNYNLCTQYKSYIHSK